MFLRTDEEQETADAMTVAAEFAARTVSDVWLWRWVVIALHSAAQGAMVLSLRHGNGLLALDDETYAKWMDAHEKGLPYPEERLDTYLGLYRKVKHRQWGSIGGNTPFAPQGTEGGDIKRLNEIRNDFIHFTPKGWSLEVNGLPRICQSVARLIGFLAIETQNIFWHSEDARVALSGAHSAFTTEMRRLHEQYAGRV